MSSYDPESIAKLPELQFRRFGIACCHRLRCSKIDKRLAKALRKLEESIGPPVNERLRRDALNAARSAYRDIYAEDGSMTVRAAIACTLVCACGSPSTSLLGNLESALMQGELLDLDEIREIEHELLKQID